jgi:hypothetical protein
LESYIAKLLTTPKRAYRQHVSVQIQGWQFVGLHVDLPSSCSECDCQTQTTFYEHKRAAHNITKYSCCYSKLKQTRRREQA